MARQRWRLATLGVSIHDELLVRSMLKIINGRTEASWEFVEDEADVALCEPGSPLAAIAVRKAFEHGRPHCVALARGDRGAETMARSIHVPLRANELIALLDSVSREGAPAPARRSEAGFEAPHLAAALERLLQRDDPAPSVWSVESAATRIEVHLPDRFYVVASPDGEAGLERIAAFGARVVVRRVDGAAHATERRVALDRALWLAGLHVPGGALIAPASAQARLRLRRWPDFGRVRPNAGHLALAALLSNRALTPSELVAQTGRGAEEVAGFLNACALCGLLEAVAIAPAPVLAARADARGFASLFRTLRSALGMATP